MEHSKQLSEAKISSLLIKFSIPAIIGMLVNALYNVVDRIFVGNSISGDLGIAGITICFPVMLATFAFMVLIGMGANSLVSIRLGQNKKEEAEHILGNAVFLLILTSLSITVLGLVFLDPLLQALGVTKEILPYAKEFMHIILLGTIFHAISFGLNVFIRGEGNPRMAMYTMLLGAFLNVVFCTIFIFGFGMGVGGSALATVLAQACSAAWVLSYFFSKKSSLKIRVANIVPNKAIITKIVALGSAPFLMQLAASLVSIIFNKSLIQYGGNIAITGMGIVTSLQALMLMPVIGINQGSQPIIGFNYGAKKYDRVQEAFKLAIFGATTLSVIGFIIVEVFTVPIVLLFNKTNPELIEFTVYALRVFFIMLPIIGFQIVGANYFTAVGKPKQSAFLSLSRQLIFLIPAVLILPLFFGIHGIIMAGPVADFLASIVTAIWIYKELKHLGHKHDAHMASQVKTI
ncbi:MAG TPA: MATE family efflux transporter [Clostridiales bacterium]|nr:MAG: MATE family efflux transporter [Clostridiales bacterium GWD2_32_19]HCC06876.1 MATE family efflux transporter [Clostridiales bacterium]